MSEDEEKQFISMLSDYGFKITFGNEQRPKFTRKALQALIASDTPIKAVKFVKNEISGTTKDARGGLFDVTCEDEQGRIFIVEMQLFDFAHFIHRVKFYAFHRFNTIVQKGHYRFDDLPQIYTISILAGRTYKTHLYHQISTLKNQLGELVDNQITHVIVELGKFNKTLDKIETDLDKLLYTMKLTETATKNTKLPDFWREGWLDEALEELNKANLTPEQRAQYEMTIAGNMTEKYAMEEQLRKREEEIKEQFRKEEEEMKEQFRKEEEEMKEQFRKEEEEMKEQFRKEEEEMKEQFRKEKQKTKEEAEEAIKEKAVINLLRIGTLSVEQIAEVQEVSKEFVEAIKKRQ